MRLHHSSRKGKRTIRERCVRTPCAAPADCDLDAVALREIKSKPWHPLRGGTPFRCDKRIGVWPLFPKHHGDRLKILRPANCSVQRAHCCAACRAGERYGAEVVDYVSRLAADCDKLRQVFAHWEFLVDGLGRAEQQLAVRRRPFVHDRLAAVGLLDYFLGRLKVGKSGVAILKRVRQSGKGRDRHGRDKDGKTVDVVHGSALFVF